MRKKDEFKLLNDQQHLLLRPQMYIGSVEFNKKNEHIWDGEKLSYTEVEYIPGLIKIINEIIDNAVDEAIRTNFEICNKIDVRVDSDSIMITDNGRGLPVIKDDTHNEYIPVLAFGHAKSGTNFTDDDRKTIGTFGVGSYCTNVFSAKFIVKTCDGVNSIKITWTDNAKKYTTNVQSKLKNPATGTSIHFWPDFSRFKLDNLSDVHKNLIHQRVYELSICYPQITFKFNGKMIRNNFKNYIKTYNEHNVIYENEDISISVCSEPGSFNFYTCVNGIRLYDGGTHIEYVKHRLSDSIISIMPKKFSSIKKTDIINNLFISVFVRNFQNPAFDSQTKARLTNSNTVIKDTFDSINFEELAKLVYRKKEILEPVFEYNEFRIQRKNDNIVKYKERKRVKCEGYLPPIGSNKYLFLCEGYSASASLSNSLGRQNIGYFAMRGVPLNVMDKNNVKVIHNKEIFHILKILNISLTENNTDMNFDKVVFATDADADGAGHIRGLLIGFFYKYAPELLKSGRVAFFKTPLIILKNKSGKIIKSFYSFDEYYTAHSTNPELFKRNTQKYLKGLGSISKDEFVQLPQIAGSIDAMIENIEINKEGEELINHWLKNEFADKRKEYIQSNDFEINAI